MTTYPAEPLSGNEAARLARLSPERIRQLADDGRLPYFWTPLGKLYERADIERLRLERERAPQRRRAS